MVLFLQDNTGYIAVKNDLKAEFKVVSFILLVLLSALSPTVGALNADAAPEAATGTTQKSLVQARRWMVSSANPLASEAGRQVLREGGSAVDAAKIGRAHV